MKKGTLTFTGDEISSAGADAEYSHIESAYIPTGDGIVLEACGYSSDTTPEAKISSGAVSSTNAAAVKCYRYGESIDITNKQFITGGTFSVNPSEYVDAYIPTGDGIVLEACGYSPHHRQRQSRGQREPF